jgi:hypothetical protein
MRIPKYLLTPLIGAISVAAAHADVATTMPFAQATFVCERTVDPVPQEIYIAMIDLSDPAVVVRVARGGPDPDGEGKWETILKRPTAIADIEHFDVVINGDFFEHLKQKDSTDASKSFVSGSPASVIGPAVSDGVFWGSNKAERPVFMIDDTGKASITTMKVPPSNARQVVAGDQLLVMEGKNVAPPDLPGEQNEIAPRTAVGLKNEGQTLVLMVIDGRHPTRAVGMTYHQEAQIMLKLGCTSALNLDGGGSSVLAIRDSKTGKIQIMNHPSGGEERPVANVLGVSIKSQ